MQENIWEINRDTYSLIHQALEFCWDYVNKYTFTLADKIILDELVSNYFIFKQGLGEVVEEDFYKPFNPNNVKANLYITSDQTLKGFVSFFNFIVEINIELSNLSIEQLEKTSVVIEDSKPWNKQW